MSARQTSDSEENERSPRSIPEQHGQQQNPTASIILSKMSLWYPERKLMMAKKIMFICLENGAGGIAHFISWNRENDDLKLVKFQAIFILNQKTSIRIMSLL